MLDILIEVARNTVYILVSVLQTAMFIRAIMSWFPLGEGKFSAFLYAITEPVIYPIRLLFDKMNWGSGLPIDIPFFVTFLLLSFLTMFL